MQKVSSHREMSPGSAVSLSSTELFSIFQLIVVVLRPATFLFWFTLTALVQISGTSGSCFQRKSSKNLLYTTWSKQQTQLETSW